VEDLLATDAAQHAEPADDVVGGVGEVAGQLALAGAAALQRGEQRPDQQHQGRHPEEHHEPEGHRGLQQDHRDQQERHDRAGEPRRGVHHLPEVRDVAGADRHDLAGRHLPRQRPAEVHGVPAHQLHGPVRRGEPVGDREPVPDDAAGRLDQADAEQHGGVRRERVGVLRRDPAVDGPADHRGHHRLAAHPHDAEQRAERERAPLALGQPHQEPHRGPVVGGAGVVEGEPPHPPTLRRRRVGLRPNYRRGRTPRRGPW
jgi:hypothetical protein